MFVYQIKNLINDKKYIGITNNIKKRWSNHKCNSDKSVIGYAIQKYGVENFEFSVLHEGLTIEEAERKEMELIAELGTSTRVGGGYNVLESSLGEYTANKTRGKGLGNPMQKLSEEDVRYIKSNRNIPLYKLYEDFVEKISYKQFKAIYNHRAFMEIEPTVDVYPYNFEYSNQFTNGLSSFGLSEVEELRRLYEKGVHWKAARKGYESHCGEEHFWKVYTGRSYSLVMPEVFSDENHAKHSSKSRGESNPRSKLKEEDVLEIRLLSAKGVPRSEIHKKFSFVSLSTIKKVISRETWKHI